jgi:hypothetical protein
MLCLDCFGSFDHQPWCPKAPAAAPPPIVNVSIILPGDCVECIGCKGWHSTACSKYPCPGKAQKSCSRCNWWNGMHASYCTHKGYLTASAPAAPVVVRGDIKILPEMCCGGTCVRAVCEYHGGAHGRSS